MKERNRNTLIKALNKLPLYSAPEGLWERLESELDRAEPAKLRPLYRRRWVQIAAAVGLLATAGALWGLLRPSTSSPSAPQIHAEQNRQLEQLTAAEIVAYEAEMKADEAQLKACLDQLPAREQDQAQLMVDKLNTLTHTRDSLSLLLNSGQGLPGANRRLSRLEMRRQLLLKELQTQLCQNSPSP